MSLPDIAFTDTHVLLAFSSAPQGLAFALHNLYDNISHTTEPVIPALFLSSLRQAFPQFAERSRSGIKGGMEMYAQQGLLLKSKFHNVKMLI